MLLVLSKLLFNYFVKKLNNFLLMQHYQLIIIGLEFLKGYLVYKAAINSITSCRDFLKFICAGSFLA